MTQRRELLRLQFAGIVGKLLDRLVTQTWIERALFIYLRILLAVPSGQDRCA